MRIKAVAPEEESIILSLLLHSFQPFTAGQNRLRHEMILFAFPAVDVAQVLLDLEDHALVLRRAFWVVLVVLGVVHLELLQHVSGKFDVRQRDRGRFEDQVEP